MENYYYNELSDDVKEWAKLSAAEVTALKRKQCSKCFYFSKNSSGGGKSDYASLGTCDYISIEGKMRPCNPLHCRELGVFKAKQRDRSKRKGIVL